MATTNESKESNKKTARGGAAAKKVAERCRPAQTFQRAYYDFERARQQAELTARQRTAEAWCTLAAAQRAAYEEALEPVSEAQTHLQAVQAKAAGSADEETRQQVFEAATAFNQAQVDFRNDATAGERCREAYADFLGVQRESLEEARQAQRKAYGSLVAGLQEAWSQVDAGNLDADTLATLQWATQVVSCLRGYGA